MRLLSTICAGVLVLGTVAPSSALMRGNPTNPNFKSSMSSAAPGANSDMSVPPKGAGSMKKRKAKQH